VKILDFGCGYGYSSLSFALLADNLIKKHQIRGSKVSVLGIDLFGDFVEKSIINYQKYRKVILNNSQVAVDF
jgi:hypothetical protein